MQATLTARALPVSSPFGTLATIATLVATADFVTKALAQMFLAGRDVRLSESVRLVLVPNDGYAWGMYFGELAPYLQTALFVVIGLLIVRACPKLSTLDRHAPAALGLIAGAGIGNLASIFTPPAGVADFIAVDRGGIETAFNIADLALVAGLALTLRTTVLVLRAIARERRPTTSVVAPMLEPWVAPVTGFALRSDAEIMRQVFVDHPTIPTAVPTSTSERPAERDTGSSIVDG